MTPPMRQINAQAATVVTWPAYRALSIALPHLCANKNPQPTTDRYMAQKKPKLWRRTTRPALPDEAILSDKSDNISYVKSTRNIWLVSSQEP